MEEKPLQLPVSEQEIQIQASSLPDKIKIHKFKILGGFLGFLVFAGAVFGAYKLGQKQAQPSGIQPTPMVETTPTPFVFVTPTSDPTTNWKTYTNEKYGFEFRYPQNLNIIVKENPEPNNLLRVYLHLPEPYLEFALEVTSRLESEILATMEKNLKRESMVLGGVKAVKYSGRVGEGISVSGTRIILSKNDLRYYFSAGTYNHQELIDLMLSTFRFLK